jgi:hypothetical protein
MRRGATVKRKLVGMQIVRFDRNGRTRWLVAAFRPDNRVLVLYWLAGDGWLPADEQTESRCRRFGSAAAARRALAAVRSHSGWLL